MGAFDEVDRELSLAERSASPSRFPSRVRGSDEIERVASTVSTSTTSSNVSESIARPTAMGISRMSTQHDLERNPTMLSRIETARSQHSGTVGRSLTSRRSKKPLPPFGAGKPYPPPLPDREDYVVEFDGPDDPLHAQNWPLKKKLYTAAILGYTTMVSAFGSSIFSAATRVSEPNTVSPPKLACSVSLYTSSALRSVRPSGRLCPS